MVFFNENISFNVKNLKNGLTTKIKCFVKDALEFYLDIEKIEKIEKIQNSIEKVQNSIEKNVKNLFSNDHFVYLNMNNGVCSHKFKKGKKEGYFCNKKINTNLEGEKEDYLCCKHSKRHIPKKRVKKEEFLEEMKTVTRIKNKAVTKIKKDIKKIYKKKKKLIKKFIYAILV